MISLIEIQNQIAALQKQAEDIRAQEFDKTVQEIQEKMAAFGITIADLDGTKGRTRKVAGKSGKSAHPAPAKYLSLIHI